MKKLKQKDVNLTDIKVFKKAAQKFLVAMVEKLLERTPLASSLLQSASIFDPQNLLQISKEKAVDLYKNLPTNIKQLNILPRNRCVQALAEFKNWVLKSRKSNLRLLCSHKKSTDLTSSFLKSLDLPNTKSFHTL